MPSALDQIMRDYVAPVMRGAGFKKKGRVFFCKSVVGDVVSVQVRAVPGPPGFYVIYGFIDALSRAYYQHLGASEAISMTAESQGVFSCRLKPGGAPDWVPYPDPDRWYYHPWEPESIAECGGALAARLSSEVVPFLLSVLPRQKLIEFLESIRSERLHWHASTPEAAQQIFRLGTMPTAEALAEIDAEAATEGTSLWEDFMHQHLSAKLEAEAGSPPAVSE